MSTKLKSHNLDTTGWNEFPFVANGVQFISKIAPYSPFMSRINKLPAGVFESLNQDAVKDLVGTTSDLNELSDKLLQINQLATHAVIELA